MKPSHTPASRCAEFADGSGRGPTGSATPSSGSRPISAIRRARYVELVRPRPRPDSRRRPPAASPTPTRRAPARRRPARPVAPERRRRRRSSRSRVPQPMSDSRPITRPSSASSPAAIRPDAGTPNSAMPDGHCLRGGTGDPGAADPLLGRGLRLGIDGRRPHRARAGVAAPARLRVRVVELAAQEHQPALRGVEVVEHRPLLGLAGRRRSAGAAPRRRPTAARSRPSRPSPASRRRRCRAP